MNTTTKAAHTPGKWYLSGRNLRSRITTKDGNVRDTSIGVLDHDSRLLGHQYADLNRIVNCVNACEGIPDPQTAIPALLEACESVVDALNGRIHSMPALKVIDDARSALAAARGETA